MVCVVQAVGLQGLVAEGGWATGCVAVIPYDQPSGDQTSPLGDAYL